MELIVLDKIDPVQVFTDNGLQPILDEIEKKAKSFVLDASTDKGRKEIGSVAAKVAKSKTFLDGKGKELVAKQKAEIKKVDVERKRARDFLDGLKAEILQPRTEWEEAEREREEYITGRINVIQGMAGTLGLTSAEIAERIAEVDALKIADGFDEYAEEVAIAKESTLGTLKDVFESVKKQEAEKAELDRLRKEAEEREKKDREERLKREAAEQAKREAEEVARAEQERVEKEKREAVEAQEAAERKAKETEEKAKAAIENEKRKAEEARLESERLAKKAKEDAEREKELAVFREKERIEAERKAEEEATRKREANKRHHAKVKAESIRFISGIYGTTDEQAVGIFDAIANGEVPHIKVHF